MPIKIHPQTRQRILHSRFNQDIVVDAEGPEALSFETLHVIGGWTDYSGEGGVHTREQLLFGGIADKLYGTDVWHEGARVKDTNVFGKNIATWRLRRKKFLLDFNDSKVNKSHSGKSSKFLRILEE